MTGRESMICIKSLTESDPMRGARVDKADLLNVFMKTRLTLDFSLWDRTIGYYGGTA